MIGPDRLAAETLFSRLDGAAGRGTAAVVLRRGPALRLTFRDGKTFLVTVDDAATGPALLNDLIAAAQRSGQ